LLQIRHFLNTQKDTLHTPGYFMPQWDKHASQYRSGRFHRRGRASRRIGLRRVAFICHFNGRRSNVASLEACSRHDSGVVSWSWSCDVAGLRRVSKSIMYDSLCYQHTW